MGEEEFIFYELCEYLVKCTAVKHGITEEEAAKKVKAYFVKKEIFWIR